MSPSARSYSPARRLAYAVQAPSRSLAALLPTIVFAVLVLVYFLVSFRTPAYPGVFEDDLFYYLVAARNIVAGHGSTFDGSHLTNGYHPLWMLVCIALTALFHGRLLLLALVALVTALVLWCYSSAVACLRVYAAPFPARALAFFLAFDLAVICGGMEVTLAVPLLFFLARYRLRTFCWTPLHGFLYGLLAAAVVLARLDAMLFVILLGTLDLTLSTEVPWKQRLSAVLPFLLGMTPVPGYLLFNLLRFGSAMPISSHAKQLRLSHGFVPLPLHAMLHFYQPELSALLRPVLVALALSLPLLVFRGWGRIAPGHRALVLALLLFPALHLGVLSFSSDWPLWRWYFYTFLACGLGASIVLLTRPERFFARIYHRAGILAVLLFLFAFLHVLREDFPSRLHAESWRYTIFHSAESLSGFAAGHPGSYAMGDRAGLVGYLLPAPLIQTEGLMMDRAFLGNIRLQRNLLGVLRSYGVRYYVATNPVPSGNCWLVREPAQGGADVPVMPGRLCSQPVHSFFQNGFRTVVFDLTQEP